jgi:hypothetical protein
MRVIGRIRLIKLIRLINELVLAVEHLMIRLLVGTGEMNSAPTLRMEAFEDEEVDGSGRNKFRPYIEDGYL